MEMLRYLGENTSQVESRLVRQTENRLETLFFAEFVHPESKKNNPFQKEILL